MLKSMIVIIPLLGFIYTDDSRADMFGGDVALLVNLVTTSASQLNELEKLVSNAEKYTEKMQKYNELLEDEYFRSERVLYLTESLASKREIENMGDLNAAVRELKYSMEDTRELLKEYSVIQKEDEKTKKMVEIQKKDNAQKEKIANSQVNKSASAKTSGRANQLTAQNTALIYEQNVQMQNTQLEMLKRMSTSNKLQADEREEKRLNELSRMQSYGIDQQGKSKR